MHVLTTAPLHLPSGASFGVLGGLSRTAAALSDGRAAPCDGGGGHCDRVPPAPSGWPRGEHSVELSCAAVRPVGWRVFIVCRGCTLEHVREANGKAALAIRIRLSILHGEVLGGLGRNEGTATEQEVH